MHSQASAVSVALAVAVPVHHAVLKAVVASLSVVKAALGALAVKAVAALVVKTVLQHPVVVTRKREHQ